MTRSFMTLAYISDIVPGPSSELEQIVRTSRDRNKHSQITGMLFSDAKSYLQILEGHAERLGQTVLRIAADERHRRMRMLLVQHSEIRIFSDWWLGRAVLEGRQRGLSRFADTLARAPPAARLTMLEKFALDAMSRHHSETEQ